MQGCVIWDVNVSNPIPQMTRIAIAPFVNLSSEKAVDGRRFAEAYFTELQKTPGFQVVPVGIAEAAMVDHKLNLDSSEDLEKLIEILDVDAIVFGAVTEYSPYYPPRIGLQVSWYARPEFTAYEAIPLDRELRHNEHEMIKQQWKQGREANKMQKKTWRNWVNWQDAQACEIPAPQIRGQSPDVESTPGEAIEFGAGIVELPQTPAGKLLMDYSGDSSGKQPLQPIMSYTRIFDGADQKVVAALKDYCELNGDQRSGGWNGYLERSEDYIRFCMHKMIEEMLQLHGGESGRRVVFAHRKYR